MISPSSAYDEYMRAAAPGGAWTAVRRPLFVAVLQGAAIAMAATHTIAAPVFASVTLCWSAAVLVQLAGAIALIRSGSAPRVGTARAIDLLFVGHAPWSLWLLGAAGVRTFAPSIPFLRWSSLAAMIVAAALTARIVAAFAEFVLGADQRQAVRRTVLHQTITLGTLIAFIAIAIQLWPRVSGLFTI